MLDFSQLLGRALCLIAICLTISSLHSSHAEAVHESPEALIRALESSDRQYLFDMHGNARRELRKLMEARFSATRHITSAIQRLEKSTVEEDQELAAALFHVLGFVKDPAAIGWLRNRWHSTVKSTVMEHWLQAWQDRPRGYGGSPVQGYGEWRWLSGRERWIATFIDASLKPTLAGDRLAIMQILSGFDDKSVRIYFERLRSTSLEPEEVLIVEGYVSAHGGRTHDSQIEAAIDKLSVDPGKHLFLIDTAEFFRHKAFIPFLISIIESPVKPPGRSVSWRPEEQLELITFALGLRGKKAWQDWYRVHGSRSREDWYEMALESFRRELARNPSAAEKQFDDAIYGWSDIIFLKFIDDELSSRPAFHKHIVDWINYSYRHTHRKRLARLAAKISRPPTHLDKASRKTLMDLEFLPPSKKWTWADEVWMATNRL